MAAIAKDGILTRIPIIVILGATGTGKSKLALQVAQKFNGEIISADAMQVYHGLDIVTNKVTVEEQRLVPHHMIDYIHPGQPTNVVDFRDKALPIIENLFERDKVPVVAGGTCYYVESLLWKLLMNSTTDEEPPAKRARGQGGGLGRLSYVLHSVTAGKGPLEGSVVRDVVEDLTPEDKARLHDALKEADPERAAELHPNNVRKVIRSLQVLDSTGRRHSELIREQKAAGGNHLGGPLRYPRSVIFWLTCEQEVLNTRLNTRVEEMIQQGLIAELQEFHKQYNLHRMQEEEDGVSKTAPYTVGIFQSIGFKEFHDYLMLSEEERQGEKGKKLFAHGVELMKCATRQYARKQVKWIRRRFLTREVEQVPPLYSLNVTDVTQWDSLVRDKAFSVVQSVLDGTPCPIVPEPHLVPVPVDKQLLRCEQCDRFFTGATQWQDHLKSQKHKRRLNQLSKKAHTTFKSLAADQNTSVAGDNT